MARGKLVCGASYTGKQSAVEGTPCQCLDGCLVLSSVGRIKQLSIVIVESTAVIASRTHVCIPKTDQILVAAAGESTEYLHHLLWRWYGNAGESDSSADRTLSWTL